MNNTEATSGSRPAGSTNSAPVQTPAKKTTGKLGQIAFFENEASKVKQSAQTLSGKKLTVVTGAAPQGPATTPFKSVESENKERAAGPNKSAQPSPKPSTSEGENKATAAAEGFETPVKSEQPPVAATPDPLVDFEPEAEDEGDPLTEEQMAAALKTPAHVKQALADKAARDSAAAATDQQVKPAPEQPAQDAAKATEQPQPSSAAPVPPASEQPAKAATEATGQPKQSGAEKSGDQANTASKPSTETDKLYDGDEADSKPKATSAPAAKPSGEKPKSAAKKPALTRYEKAGLRVDTSKPTPAKQATAAAKTESAASQRLTKDEGSLRQERVTRSGSALKKKPTFCQRMCPLLLLITGVATSAILGFIKKSVEISLAGSVLSLSLYIYLHRKNHRAETTARGVSFAQ